MDLEESRTRLVRLTVDPMLPSHKSKRESTVKQRGLVGLDVLLLPFVRLCVCVCRGRAALLSGPERNGCLSLKALTPRLDLSPAAARYCTVEVQRLHYKPWKTQGGGGGTLPTTSPVNQEYQL